MTSEKQISTVPEELASQDDIRGFKTLASHPGLHSASVPGILAVDINANNPSKILTGGADKNATVFNKDDEQVRKKRLLPFFNLFPFFLMRTRNF